MRYYLHDSNAFHDEKISELFIAHGYEGLGLYWTLLEKLAAQEKPIKTLVLKRQLQVGKKLEKVWSFMEQIGLISSSNDHTSSVRIISYIESYKKKREDSRKRVEQYRENQEDTEDVTRNKRVRNAPKGKVKESKVNKGDTNVSPGGGDDSAEPENSPVDQPSDDKPFKVKRDKAGKMIRPTLEVLTGYVLTRENGTQAMALKMFEHYGANGWKIGKTPMENWNLAACKWVRNNQPGGDYGPPDDTDDATSSSQNKSKSSFI